MKFHASRVIRLGIWMAVGTLGCSQESDGIPSALDGGAQPSSCSITVESASYSPTIGTVGVVTWSTTLQNVDRAQIEFGLDTKYGMTASVDLTAAEYRTPLLGMKQDAGPYHFRIVAESGGRTCTGPDNVFAGKTGTAPSDLEAPTITTYDKGALDGGFLVTVGYNADSPDDYAFILDGDGDVVWWYKPAGFGDLTAARMSYDGKHMWIAHANVPRVEARVGRVTMDGTAWEDLRSQFENQDHDFAVLPDESIVYLSYQWNECDDVVERSPDGTNRTIINSAQAFGNAFICHCNAIQYSPWDDTVVVSDDDHSGYFKVDRQGNIKWVLGGGESNSFDKSGGGASTWIGNHNLHLLGLDDLLFFNNGVDGVTDGVPAVARELKLDLKEMTTSEVWSYSANPSISDPILGDVQRLADGNTIVAYSSQGIVQEVGAEGTLLQEISWGSGKPLGYITKRKSLYGPPPR